MRMVWQVKRCDSQGVCHRSNEIYTTLALAKSEMELTGYQVYVEAPGTTYMCRGIRHEHRIFFGVPESHSTLAPPDFAVADDWAVISEEYLLWKPSREPEKKRRRKGKATSHE